MDFQRGLITPESAWRALILYGANSATYKFAFGTVLLEHASNNGPSTVSVAELAPRFAELLCAALGREPRQGTAAKSRFLDACRAYNAGELDRDLLCRRTEELGFANVVTAFQRLPSGAIPVQYYEDRRSDPSVRGLVLRDELFAAAQSFQAANLGLETDARWRLVETAWATGVARGLLGPVLIHDAPTASLIVVTKRRRRSVTGVVGALSGYQDGRCAYCEEPMLLRGLGQEVVEHVLPWRLDDQWEGPDLDAVWNLVLSCQPCNSAKHGRAPSERWMPWLERRNNHLIASHHPLRETLMAQTGETSWQRHATLRGAYAHATELLPAVWEPPTAFLELRG